MNDPTGDRPSDADPTSLRRLQAWMQSVITHPLGVEAGIASAAAARQIPLEAADLESVVLPSSKLDSAARLEVYANAYYSRLLECMRDSFPVLVYALGAELFDEFAYGYLQRHPSTSYTLHRLSDQFVAYLQETRPDGDECGERDEADGGEPDWPDFVIDLARLETTFDEVFDGPGMERSRPLTAEDLAGISPDQWAETRLEPAPCLRLLSFQFPVNAYYSQWRRGESPAIPGPQRIHLAVSRKDYVVRRYELSPPEHRLLSSLAAGETVGDAIADVASQFDDVEQLGGSLAAWFERWGAAQLFRSAAVHSR